jgi:hypothetical protein
MSRPGGSAPKGGSGGTGGLGEGSGARSSSSGSSSSGSGASSRRSMREPFSSSTVRVRYFHSAPSSCCDASTRRSASASGPSSGMVKRASVRPLFELTEDCLGRPVSMGVPSARRTSASDVAMATASV